MTPAEMESALRILLDRQAIHDCIMTYSRGVDRLDRDLLMSVYHDDAIDDHGVFIGGPDEMVGWAFANHRRSQFTHQHCQFNHTCDLAGDVAHTETYYMFVGMNDTIGEPYVIGGGRYVDRFERREGRWAIAARKCIRDWAPMKEHLTSARQIDLTVGRAWLRPGEVELLETCSQSARDRSDPSYERPLTVDVARRETYLRLTRDQDAVART